MNELVINTYLSINLIIIKECKDIYFISSESVISIKNLLSIKKIQWAVQILLWCFQNWVPNILNLKYALSLQVFMFIINVLLTFVCKFISLPLFKSIGPICLCPRACDKSAMHHNKHMPLLREHFNYKFFCSGDSWKWPALGCYDRIRCHKHQFYVSWRLYRQGTWGKSLAGSLRLLLQFAFLT